MTASNPYASSGMLPTEKSFGHLTQDDIRKVCWQTQAMRDYPGRKPSQEVIGENYVEIHGIGQRHSKYFEFEVNKAPLLNRLCCRHTQAYVPLPLGDNKVNKALAESFKGGLKGNASTNPIPLDGETKMDTDYPSQRNDKVVENLRKAKCPNFKPEFVLTHTVCPPGKLLETKSHNQRVNVWPADETTSWKSKPAVPPVAGLYIGGAGKNVVAKSANRREYTREACRVRKVASVPNLNQPPMAPMDPEVFFRARVSYMMPGQ